MPITDILYIVLIVATVVLTVAIVWLSNEAIGLMKSLRKSADDTAVVTREFKEKVLLASEALDRVGTAATTILGMIEEAVQSIKGKRDKLADGIATVTGLGKYAKRGQSSEDEEDEEDEGDEAEPGEGIVVPPKEPAQKNKLKPEEKDKEEEKVKEEKDSTDEVAEVPTPEAGVEEEKNVEKDESADGAKTISGLDKYIGGGQKPKEPEEKVSTSKAAEIPTPEAGVGKESKEDGKKIVVPDEKLAKKPAYDASKSNAGGEKPKEKEATIKPEKTDEKNKTKSEIQVKEKEPNESPKEPEEKNEPKEIKGI